MIIFQWFSRNCPVSEDWWNSFIKQFGQSVFRHFCTSNYFKRNCDKPFICKCTSMNIGLLCFYKRIEMKIKYWDVTANSKAVWFFSCDKKTELKGSLFNKARSVKIFSTVQISNKRKWSKFLLRNRSFHFVRGLKSFILISNSVLLTAHLNFIKLSMPVSPYKK